jgi:hypothetical protein
MRIVLIIETSSSTESGGMLQLTEDNLGILDKEVKDAYCPVNRQSIRTQKSTTREKPSTTAL